MLISVWGKNGSGKSTAASGLASAYARRGHKTALVGANRFYGSIQYFFDMRISDGQSIRPMLAGSDSLSIQDKFVECASVKNLFIASLADRDDCAGYTKMRIDAVVRFINLVKKSFDVAVFDCDESTEDPLSMYSLTLSEKIVYVTRPTVQSVVFAKAYEPIVAGLQIKNAMTILLVGEAGTADIVDFFPFGIGDRRHVLPYSKAIQQARGYLSASAQPHGSDRDLARYRRGIDLLACELVSGSTGNGSDNIS